MLRVRNLAATLAVAMLAWPAGASASTHTATAATSRARAARAACANANTAATARNLAAMRRAIVCLVNRQRAAHGLPALGQNRRLDRSSQSWTRTMVLDEEFTHGAKFWARISAVGFDWSYVGENIATGYRTPKAVMRGWMASQGHCENILDPGFSAIGIGVVARPVHGFASGPATWTQDFGLPMNRPAPSHNQGPANRCPY